MPEAHLILKVGGIEGTVKRIDLTTEFGEGLEYPAVNALVERLRERLKNAHNAALSAEAKECS